jgi:hypothetical protein
LVSLLVTFSPYLAKIDHVALAQPGPIIIKKASIMNHFPCRTGPNQAWPEPRASNEGEDLLWVVMNLDAWTPRPTISKVNPKTDFIRSSFAARDCDDLNLPKIHEEKRCLQKRIPDCCKSSQASWHCLPSMHLP